MKQYKQVGWLYKQSQGNGLLDTWVVVIGNANAPTKRESFSSPSAAIEFADEIFSQEIRLEETLNSELGYRIKVLV